MLSAVRQRNKQRVQELQTKVSQLESLEKDLGQIAQLREELEKLQGDKDDSKV
jgi:hypothetical protein